MCQLCQSLTFLNPFVHFCPSHSDGVMVRQALELKAFTPHAVLRCLSRQYAGHLLIHVCQSWEMGTPVIWAPKKDVSQGCAFDSKTFMISDPKLPASSGWKSCVGLLAVWLKSSFNISEQNRRYPTGTCCWQSWPCYFLWRSPLISWQYEETRFKSRVIIDHCHSPAQEVTNAFVTSALTFRKAFSQGISLLTNVREFAHDGRTARHSNAEYDARYCAVSCLL